MANAQGMQVEIDGAMAARIRELEAWIDAIPTGALIDYYYNSVPKNEDAIRAARVLDVWMAGIPDDVPQAQEPQ